MTRRKIGATAATQSPERVSTVAVPGYDLPYERGTKRAAWARAAHTAATGSPHGWHDALVALNRTLDSAPCLGGCGRMLGFRGYCGRSTCLPPSIDPATGAYRREFVLSQPHMRQWIEHTPPEDRAHWIDTFPDIPYRLSTKEKE